MSDQDASSMAIIPTTGEIVPLDDPEKCARALVEIRELERKLRELKRVLGESIVEYSRQQGSKTVRFEGVTAQVGSFTKTEWDYEILSELVDAGLSEDRFNELVLMEVSYKINGSVANSISRSNENYAEIIRRAKKEIPRDATVTVKES